MANRYWVGGTASWDATAGTKWALTSGGAGGQAVPTSSDTVFFDANSGANTVTIGAGTAICSTLTMTGFTGTLAFGSNSITIASNGTNVFLGATTYSVTGTPLINLTYSGSAGISVSPASVTEANSISFNISAGSYGFTIGGAIKNLTFSGTYTGNLVNSSKTIYGNLTLKTGMTITAGTGVTTFAATSGTQTITSAALNLDFPITFSGTATYQLIDNLAVGTATSRTITLTSGTLDLNNKTFTNFGVFSSSNSNTRSVAFGTTGNLTLTNTATANVIDMLVADNFTYTGTSAVNLTGNIASGITRTVRFGATSGGTEANSLNYITTAGQAGSIASFPSSTVNTSVKNLVFTTGFAGALASNGRTIYGNFTCSSTMSHQSGTGTTTFASTSGIQQITLAGTGSTFDSPVTFNGTATYQLQDAFTTGATRTVTLTSGSLDLNGFAFTCGFFSSNNSNTRTIAFGTTGQFYITGSAGSVWRTDIATGLTITGTNPTANFTYSGSVGTRSIINGNTFGSYATAISANITAGSDTVSNSSLSSWWKNLDFTGFSGISNFGGFVIGSIVYSPTMTNLNFGTNLINWNGTTQTITSNGMVNTNNHTIGQIKTITAASGDGTTVTLTYSTTYSFPYPVGSTITVLGMTPTSYNGTYTVTATTQTTVSYANTSTAAVTVFGQVAVPGSVVKLNDAFVSAATVSINQSGGTLDLNGYDLTCGFMSVNVLCPRTIAFGANQIYLTGSNGNPWSNSSNGFVATGSKTVNLTYSGSVGTRGISAVADIEAYAVNVNVLAGSDTVNVQGSRSYGALNFTGFSGTINNTSTAGFNIYGSATIPATATFGSAFVNTWYFSSTSTTQTLTTNGITFPNNVNKTGVGGTLRLGDNLVTPVQVSLTSGTLDSNGYNITCDNLSFNNTAIKTLNLTNCVFTITGGSTTSGWYGSGSNTTSNLTGSNIIFTTSGTARMLPSATFPLVTMAGTGTLLIGQTSVTTTITTLQNTVQPCTISLIFDCTRLAVTNFNLSGTAGNLVTFNSSVAGTAVNIRKTSGTVNAQYMYIQDSLADGGAVWNAPFSTNGGNNTGWNFSFIYTGDVSEAFSILDLISTIASFSSNVTEPLTLVDTPSTTAAFNSDTTEPITLADSPTVLKTLFAAVIEDASFAESSTGFAIFAKAIVEAATLADSPAVILTINNSITESLTLDNSQTVVANFASVALEGVNLADSQTVIAAFSTVITENTDLADVISATTAFVSSLTEALNAADSSLAVRIHNSDATEIITLANTQTVIAAFSALVAENIAPADSITVIASFTSQITENLVLLDSPFPRGWYAINDGQTGNWAAVNNTESSTWTSINDGQTVTWVPVRNDYP